MSLVGWGVEKKQRLLWGGSMKNPDWRNQAGKVFFHIRLGLWNQEIGCTKHDKLTESKEPTQAKKYIRIFRL